MSYAYWRKCDFQIHSPRDPNWNGARPPGVGDEIDASGKVATKEEVLKARAQWAKNFIIACLEKGLEAIALTDHNEIVMLPYVQQAIRDLKQKDSNLDIWLFPGMELTINGGKQVIILFDADLSEDWLRQAQGKLGISYADLDDNRAFAPPVTQLACNYPDISKELDEIEGLKGKYIVLPNVSQGGQHTVLTDGNHSDFKRMPYVGGYLDRGQTIETLSSKNRARLSGEISQWSDREIYPLPTSDSRTADFTDLGSNDTWIKLATPTAEAIRQAFLGYQSRIRIKPPTMPALLVASIEIHNTTIFHDSLIEISPELNSIIGGRGSGKSSFLEYLAFGLGRSCHDLPREKYSGTERLSDLIFDTLISKNGSVKIKIIQDKAVFEVIREPSTQFQPKIIYPNGSHQTITVSELRELFPATVYCQGELSEIGKQTEARSKLSDLFQFVNLEYKREDDKLSVDIDTAKTKMKAAIQNLSTYWESKARLRKLIAARDSLKQRISALEKTLPKQSEDDQAKVNYYEEATEFEGKRIQASKHADQILQNLKESAEELGDERDLSSTLTEDTKFVDKRYRLLFQEFHKGISKLIEDISQQRNSLKIAEQKWLAKYESARKDRDSVLEKLSEPKTATTQIIHLREELKQRITEIGDLETEIKTQGDPDSTLNDAISNLRALSTKRAEKTQEWAAEIQRLSNEKIKALVKPIGDISQIKEAIDFIASKTGSQEAR